MCILYCVTCVLLWPAANCVHVFMCSNARFIHTLTGLSGQDFDQLRNEKSYLLWKIMRPQQSRGQQTGAA